ncbi:hypothetical protein POM88_049291 [Heracleum sosnowskyi]|uniref:Uncharacterized protein n=1 Tax=Heracleum sosnowskyi TaxID=360622 RepID=A0AAD8GXY4_9APIA|nr:hypothetical protein POM88_049291 [Heracleum sosnowskyi]
MCSQSLVPCFHAQIKGRVVLRSVELPSGDITGHRNHLPKTDLTYHPYLNSLCGYGSGDSACFDVRTGKSLGRFSDKCPGSMKSIARVPIYSELPVLALCGTLDAESCQLLSAKLLVLMPLYLRTWFGHDSISNDYKVVTLVFDKDGLAVVQVYSTNSDSWSQFQTTVVTNLKAFDVDNVVVDGASIEDLRRHSPNLPHQQPQQKAESTGTDKR